MDEPLLFINKTQFSSLLSRSQAEEKSNILRYVQGRRRRGAANRRAQPWSEVTFSMTAGQGSSTLQNETTQKRPEEVADRRTLPFKKSVNHLLYTYPTHNGFDPFHCTVVGYDAGTHAMLKYTFASAAKTTFLAEALAPTQVSVSRSTMRHDNVIDQRLKQCVEDKTLLYATLAYGCSCIGWMQGVIDTSRPPEYFLDMAIQALQKRLLKPDHHTDPWLPVSIYALAITEMWNGIPDMWERCPERYAMMLHTIRPGPAAALLHLRALLHVVDKAGGWDKFDPYVLESAILADKYLAVYEMEPPIIPLTWDPGVPPADTALSFAISGDTLPKLGERIWPLTNNVKLKTVLSDVVEFLRIAHALWRAPGIGSEEESWLFFRFQAMKHRLMTLISHKDFQSLNRCICLASLVFLYSITPYGKVTPGLLSL